jgi:transcriptional regulator of arginine metabolism
MSKLSRHKEILELLDEGPVSSQEELQRLLHRRGFDAGQATLSRDIRELGLAKSAGGYSLPGREAATETDLPSVDRLVREFVTSVRAAQNLLVTKTSTGSAQPVAAALDSEHWPEAIGTVAGDDTILIIG